MTNRLAPKFAHYGLLANFTLSALDDLRNQVAEGQAARPTGDDIHRLQRLQELLITSRQGGNVGRAASGEVHLSDQPNRSPAQSTRRKLDDARIVSQVLPAGYSLDDFVVRANPVLDQLMKRGLGGVTDTEFLEGPMTDFLRQLARGNRGTQSATRRPGRQRVSLA